MNYQRYPFDYQTCQINLTSNKLTNEQLMLKWNNKTIIDDGFYMSTYLLKDYHKLANITQNDNKTYSTLIVDLNLRRQFTHYVLTLFLPSILIVATSWVSFWLEINSIPGRVTICVTTLLALVTVSKESKQDIPKVSYIKAIDLWFAGCIGMCVLPTANDNNKFKYKNIH